MLKESGISAEVAYEISENFSGLTPKVLGTCIPQIGLILISPPVDVYVTTSVLLHEVGHWYAYCLGLDYRNKMIADCLSALVSQAQQDTFWRVINMERGVLLSADTSIDDQTQKKPRITCSFGGDAASAL
jgi:hypothetical protein